VPEEKALGRTVLALSLSRVAFFGLPHQHINRNCLWISQPHTIAHVDFDRPEQFIILTIRQRAECQAVLMHPAMGARSAVVVDGEHGRTKG